MKRKSIFVLLCALFSVNHYCKGQLVSNENVITTIKKTIQERPKLTATLIPLGCLALYKARNPVKHAITHTLASLKKIFIQNCIWPAYYRYAQIKENGVTRYDVLDVFMLGLAGCIIKYLHSQYNIFSVGKKTALQGINILGSFIKNNPKTSTSVCAATLLVACTIKLYRNVMREKQAKSLPSLDQFLLRVGCPFRQQVMRSPQLQSLIINENCLNQLVDSEEFHELVSGLSEEEQRIIYSLVEECHEVQD